MSNKKNNNKIKTKRLLIGKAIPGEGRAYTPEHHFLFSFYLNHFNFTWLPGYGFQNQIRHIFV